jgi:adenylate cyclase
LVKSVGAEFEQFMNVMDMGDRDSMRRLFPNLRDAVFGKIAALFDAERAGLLILRDGKLQPAAGNLTEALRDLAGQSAEQGEIVNLRGHALGSGMHSVLCVPIRSRNEEVRAVVQLVNKRGGDGFTSADERAFRDFAGPLGMIVEGCERVAVQN